MERQAQIKPQKRIRKRIQCNICGGNIIEGFYEMHRGRCQFLNTLRKCSTNIRDSSQRREIKKQKNSSDESDEQCEIVQKKEEIHTQSEEDDRQKLERAYGLLLDQKRQAEAKLRSKRRELINFDITNEAKEACTFCGIEIRHRIVHEEYCPSRHNFCQFCGQEFTIETMSQHHRSCSERLKIKKIQMLMHDSSEQASSSDPENDDQQDLQERFFRPRPQGMLIRPREDDIYQTNPYVRTLSHERRDPDLIYTHTPPLEGSPYYSIEVPGMHRPLYRYRRQYFPVRHQVIHQPTHIDSQLEKRVTQSLTRYGYDLKSLEKLRGHPKFHHYLRLIDGYIHDNENPFSEGMTQYEISNLKLKKYESKKTEEQQQEDICAICYTVFQENEDIIKLTCNHYFHQFCVKKWLEVNFRCPICKFHQVSRKISIQS